MTSMVMGMVMAAASAMVSARDEGNVDTEAWKVWKVWRQDERGMTSPRAMLADRQNELDIVLASAHGDFFDPESVMSLAEPQAAPGEWQVACERESGGTLQFDRGSLREYGSVTLFRWGATGAARTLEPGDVFTAVANCRQKTIEASWPGESRTTRAGTCGRELIDAVCSAANSAPRASDRRPTRRTR